MAVTVNLDPSELPAWKHAAAKDYREKRTDFLRAREREQARVARAQAKIEEIDGQIADLDRGAKAFGLPVDPASDSPPPTLKPRALGILRPTAPIALQFKDVALQLLKEAWPDSLTAAEVQDAAQRLLGREFHWKTAGMTLYRLKLDGRVFRQGQQWYFDHSGEGVTDDPPAKPEELEEDMADFFGDADES